MSELVLLTSTVSIRRISVSEMDNNVYLLTSRGSGAQILIDAAADADRIWTLVGDGAADAVASAQPNGGYEARPHAVAAENVGSGLQVVITTHQHWDHVRALADIVSRSGARSLAGGDAADITAACRVPTTELADLEMINVADISLQVITLRGHTPGSIALIYREAGHPVQIFTGDSLFPGGVGNTGQDSDRFETLLNDVTAKIFNVFDDNTGIHPGHGKATNLGAERPQLAAWKARGW